MAAAYRGGMATYRKGMDMQTARPGDRARVHYVVKLEDGQIVGGSRGSQPLSFRIGKGKLIKPLEQAVIGMQVGQSRSVTVSPQEGYGQRNEDLVITVEKNQMPQHMDAEVGRTIQYMGKSGELVNMIVTAVGDNTVTLDANHPFAGLTLTYDITLVSLSEI
jgi:FKBP-type peptidyl-prolyl cis-trans isomerase 2